MIFKLVFFLAASFLLGSIPFGQVISRLHSGVDLRTSGSGNIGATNVARTLGPVYGVMTLILDAAKGLTPVLLAATLFSPEAGETGESVFLTIPQASAGLFALLGHCYSPFMHFRGGKGVATALGAFLGMIPWAVVFSLIVFIIVVARWGYVSAGSLSGALTAPAAAWLIGYPAATCLTALLAAIVIIVRHRENIERLFQGKENHWRKRG